MKKILFSIVLLIVIFVFIKMMSMKNVTPVTDVASINESNIIAPFAPKSHKNWWNRPGKASELFGYPHYSYWENFENMNDKPAPFIDDSDDSSKKVKKEAPVMEFAPDTPGPADIYNNKPYHLLGDEMSPPRVKESLSCVNSRSCYATDFERGHDKTGNFSQTTNNYKRNYPDSCSAPYQELTLNYYKIPHQIIQK